MFADSKYHDRIKNFLEYFILILYALRITEFFLYKTTFRITWPNWFAPTLNYVIIACVLVKLLVDDVYSIMDIIVMFVFTVIFLMAARISGCEIIAQVLYLMLGMKNIKPEKVVSCYFVSVLSLLLITLACAQTGMIDNLIYHMDGRPDRYSFGTVYPTCFSAFVFWLSMAWLYIRRKTYTYIELIVMSIIAAVNMYFTDTRTGFVSIMIGVILFVAVRFYKKVIEKKQIAHCWNKIMSLIRGILIFSMPVCATVMIGLSGLYNSDNNFINKLDGLLSLRLFMGSTAFERYNVKLFGQFVAMVGNGGDIYTQFRSGEYFYIDCAYIQILLCYGICVFICCIGSFIYLSAKYAKRKDILGQIIILVVSINVMAEDTLFELCFNPFLLIIFAETVSDNVIAIAKKRIG